MTRAYGPPQPPADGRWGPPRRVRRPWRWLLPLLALAVVAVVVVTLSLAGGEAPASHGEVPAPRQDGDAVPDMPGETRSPRPEDRDPAAVTAALRRLDPCRMLDLALARQRGARNAVTVPTGPHTCVLAASADPLAVRYGLTLAVGTFSDQFRRYSGAPTVLAGARVYEFVGRPGPTSSCRVVIPVSFVLAVQLSYQVYGSVDLCPTVREYAQAAVTRLRDPDTVAYRDSVPPFATWDACALLGRLTGETSAEYQPFDEPDMTDPGLSHGDLLSGCRTKGNTSRLWIRYGGQRRLAGEKSRQIGGRTVLVSGRGPCTATWDQGPSGSPLAEYATVGVVLAGADCATAASMAEEAMAVAGQRPGGVEPFHPLLFAPEDNDTGSLGACVDLGVAKSREYCEPYHELPLPKDPDDIMAARTVNRNVQCAVFVDAVMETFGERFAPVTWGEHCFFVEPEHMVQIRVNVDPENPPADYGNDRTTIAGKPAVTYWGPGRTTFAIYLSPYDDLDRPGNLHLRVEMIGGRGKEVDVTPPLPGENAGLATTAMARAVEAYFH